MTSFFLTLRSQIKMFKTGCKVWMTQANIHANKTSCTLPPSDLESTTAFQLWLWCHLPRSGHYHFGCYMCASTFITGWLWKPSWFVKKEMQKNLWRHASVPEIHHQRRLDLMATCFSAVNNLFSPPFLSPLGHSLWINLFITITIEQLHPWCQDDFIKKVVTINKDVWE